MNRTLLFLVAVIIMGTASAHDYETRVTPSQGNVLPAPPIRHRQALIAQQEATTAHDVKFSKKNVPVVNNDDDDYLAPMRLRRPAGAFTGFEVIKNGVDQGLYLNPFICVKPFTYYTFWAELKGYSEDDIIFLAPGANNYPSILPDWSNDYIARYGLGHFTVPRRLIDENYELPFNYPYEPEEYLNVNSNYRFDDLNDEEEGEDLLMSSKTFFRRDNVSYLMIFYSGCLPHGDNDEGWWFGKNGGRENGIPVDGIAQAFEKPTSPYRLKQVVLSVSQLVVKAPVEMSCKIYRIADIPAYCDEECVTQDEVPGDLIATGRALLTPESEDLICFDLWTTFDGKEQEIQPIIDDNILVVVDGYNDPSMDNLVDFTAAVSSDFYTDEGFGELAYLKYGLSDSEGNFSGQYKWVGLNYFFSSGMMKTGFSIFLTMDYPYVALTQADDDGQFTFSAEGGVMEKVINDEESGTTVTTRSIALVSSEPSANGWSITCDDHEVPDWLNIELVDGMNEDGTFDRTVNAVVTAAPLPEGMNYRTASVRFEIPGDHVDYMFMQVSDSQVWHPCDLNYDGEINIADVNVMIGYIFNNYDCADLNNDGEANIADLNILIGHILNIAD